MRITSTIRVTYRDLILAVLIFGTGALTLCCIWTLIHGRQRYIEQPFGVKTKHRQKGLSALKNITRHVAMKQKSKTKIVDPPVDGELIKNLQHPEHEKVESGRPDFNRQIYPEEYALRDISKLTSSTKSLYRIEGDRESIKLGGTLHVTIQAKDARNKNRGKGGDFWFATLATKRNSSGTAGRVVDHDNGTYSVYFTVGWAGVVSLEVTLVHPSQVASVLTNVVWNERDRVEWRGRFELAPNGTVNSDQRCVLRRQYVSLIRECVMAHPPALGQTVLVCGTPGGGIPCEGLSAVYSNITAISQRIKSITRNYYNVFSRDHFKRRLTRGPSQLIIKESREFRQKLLIDQTNLTVCQPDQSTPKYGRGYWENNVWHSLMCRTKNKWENRTEIGECLRGKEVYFLGDSTIRLWMELLLEIFGVPIKKTTSDKQYIHREIKLLNTSLTFRLHPLTSNPIGTRYRKLVFDVDVLDSLKSKACNYVVVISAWADFSHWTRESYVERISLVRDAVLRLRARCPDVKIVVTGPHPREQPSKESRIYHNDLIINRLGEILENAFNQSGALYLNLWDLNLGYPSSKKLHMPKAVVEGELSMFLSYVCGVCGKYE